MRQGNFRDRLISDMTYGCMGKNGQFLTAFKLKTIKRAEGCGGVPVKAVPVHWES